MKPNDVIITRLNNGIEKAWTITAVMPGGANQEGVVEMEPICGMTKNSEQHPTRCPIDILEDAMQHGTTKLYSA